MIEIICYFIVLYLFLISFKLFKNYFKKINQGDDNDYDLPKPTKHSKGFPNGWYVLMDSNELPINSVKPKLLCGQQLVVFRGTSGQVYALDAYCPHLGANLGVGGKVLNIKGDDCISCPFHGWTFSGSDGKCVKIPNIECNEIPTNAKLNKWILVERNFVIYIWFHTGGIEPPFMPDDFNKKYEIKFDSFVKSEVYFYDTIQNLSRQLFDLEHFETVHGSFFIFQIVTLIKELPREHPGCLQRRFNMKSKQIIKCFNHNLIEVEIEIAFIGPSIAESIVKSNYSWLPKILVLFDVYPYSECQTKMVFRVFKEKSFLSQILSRVLIKLFYILAEKQDKHILCNARDIVRPVFTKNDALIIKFNRWWKSLLQGSDDI